MHTKIVTKRELDATLLAQSLNFTPKILCYVRCPIPGDVDKISQVDYNELETLEWYYLTMETLNKLEGKLSKEDKDNIINMYATLYDNGLVYYDVHRDNLVRDQHGNIKLIDFGHALSENDEPPIWFPFEKLTKENLLAYARGELY